MAYIGNEPVIGQWRKLDDISGSFNGSLTSFTTQVGGTNVTAGSANQLLVSLGGVLQEPGTDYSVSSSTITFTTAPAASLSFFAVLAGDALNTSVPADGSITTAKLGANLTVDLGLGSAGTPSLTFDADTGLFSGGDNQVNVSTSGVERAEFGASEVVFNDGGADYDFRVEGDTEANLLVVDASTDRVGLGTSSPGQLLHLRNASNPAIQIDDTTNSQFIASITSAGSFGNNSTVGQLYLRGAAGIGFTGDNGTSTGMVFTSGNRLGIGTTSPGQTLHVNAASGDVTGRFSATSAAGTNSVVGFIAGTSGTAALQFGDSGSSDIGQIRYENSNDSMVFNVNGSNRVTIDSSGRLLVGVATASVRARAIIQGNSSGTVTAELYMAGDTNSPGATSSLGNIYFSDNGHSAASYIAGSRDGGTWTSGSSQPSLLAFATTADGSSTPTERMKIDSNGRLFVPGVWNFSTSGGTTVVVTSDNQIRKAASSIKYKTDVEDLEDAYADQILNIRPVWYRSLCDGDNPAHGYWGFIAEEVAEIDPRLTTWKFHDVSYDENGSRVVTKLDTPEPEGVAYDRFVPHLLNLIKRQKEQLESQAATIAALDARLTALESA